MISDAAQNSQKPGLLKKAVSLLPDGAPSKIYNAALRVPVARDILGAIVRSAIPESIQANGCTIYLDREDIAVSGALALKGFESYETELFEQALRPGMTVLDVGAHIGYYTLIAARKVGPTGRVIAFEPEPRNNALLRKNVAANKLSNVVILDVAASDSAGSHDLFLEKYNKGHHSFGRGSASAERITVKTDTIDHALERFGSPAIDLMKIDIEGAEPIALRGMKETIARSPAMTIFAEAYPKCLERLGTPAAEYLRQLTTLGFKLWEINEIAQNVAPIADIARFVASIPSGEGFKNIIAEKK